MGVAAGIVKDGSAVGHGRVRRHHEAADIVRLKTGLTGLEKNH
jgi:hypothetical protein